MIDLLTWVRAVLTTTPTRWLELTRTLPAELLTLPPAPKEWSATACLQHLIDTEQNIFPVRIGHFLAGRDFPAFYPDAEGTSTSADVMPGTLAETFARLRTTNLGLLDSLTAADLTRTAHHQELGVVALSNMIHEWAAHDLMHTVQAERALMQPFIQGSGAWQVYFTDHVATKQSA